MKTTNSSVGQEISSAGSGRTTAVTGCSGNVTNSAVVVSGVDEDGVDEVL